MSEMVFCQSCAMPLMKPEDKGRNKDGSINELYCAYCYKDGNFTTDCTMADMIEQCVPHVSKGNPYPNEEAAREAMNEMFPKLERWKK